MTQKKIRKPADKTPKNAEPVESGNRVVKLAIGKSAIRADSVPVKYDMPTEIGTIVATVWQFPWSLDVTCDLDEAEISTDIVEKDTAKIRAQNIFLAAFLIDKDKGWENLPRVDGSLIPFTPPNAEIEATAEDCRVQLSVQAPSMMAAIKEESLALVACMTRADRKNLKSLLATVSKNTPSKKVN